MIKYKNELKAVATGIHSILGPLGFQKDKLNWRRISPESIQQFSLIPIPRIPGDYQIFWGINLLKFSQNEKLQHYKFHAKWNPTGILYPKEIVFYRQLISALDFNHTLLSEERTLPLTALINRFVLPVFELYQTFDSVREMMGNPKAPLRAESYNCPEEWWPARL